MKYKVGDKVKIHGVTDHRSSYNGKEVTIISLNPNGSGGFEKKPHYGVGEVYIFFENELAPVKTANNKKIVITTDGTETLARLYDGNKVVKKSTAKCSPDDTFDFNVGAKLAFERLMNDEGKWRVVHRKPKVGDYIRLVVASFSFNKVGDILKVDNVYNTGSVEVLAKNHPRETMAPASKKWMYTPNEFEVIEPANSAVEEKKEEYYNGKVVCVGLNGCNLSTYTVGKIYQFVDGQMTCDNGGKMPSYKHVKNFEEWDEFSSSDFVEIVV